MTDWITPELEILTERISSVLTRQPDCEAMVNAAMLEAANRRGTQLATAAVLLFDRAEQLEDVPTVATLHAVVALLAKAELDLHAIMDARRTLAGLQSGAEPGTGTQEAPENAREAPQEPPNPRTGT